MTPSLPPGAFFLLGMLVGAPRTADELHALLPAALKFLEEAGADEVELTGLIPTLLALYDAGPDEISRRLDRAVEFALADRVDLGSSVLYAARRVLRDAGSL